MWVYRLHAWYLWKSETVVDFPKTGDCELPYECWKLIPGPLEEQPVLLPPHAISLASPGAGFFFFAYNGKGILVNRKKR